MAKNAALPLHVRTHDYIPCGGSLQTSWIWPLHRRVLTSTVGGIQAELIATLPARSLTVVR